MAPWECVHAAKVNIIIVPFFKYTYGSLVPRLHPAFWVEPGDEATVMVSMYLYNGKVTNLLFGLAQNFVRTCTCIRTVKLSNIGAFLRERETSTTKLCNVVPSMITSSLLTHSPPCPVQWRVHWDASPHSHLTSSYTCSYLIIRTYGNNFHYKKVVNTYLVLTTLSTSW